MTNATRNAIKPVTKGIKKSELMAEHTAFAITNLSLCDSAPPGSDIEPKMLTISEEGRCADLSSLRSSLLNTVLPREIAIAL